MTRVKKIAFGWLIGLLVLAAFCFGLAFVPQKKSARAETPLSTENWTLAIEGTQEFRVQNGTAYWTGATNGVTTASLLDYTVVNGKTLSEFNEEAPGSVSVTLQPADASIGSFYRVSFNAAVTDFTTKDMATVVVKSGWSHSDSSGTYTLGSDLYFAHKQNKSSNESANWKYIPVANVVDIADKITFNFQNLTSETTCESKGLLFGTSDTEYWTSSEASGVQPNEGGATFLDLVEINGKSIKAWNAEGHALAESGEISDITFGSTKDPQKRGGIYAPIWAHNSGYASDIGSFFRAYVPTAFISDFSSVKLAEGFAFLTDGGSLYYVGKDVEFIRYNSYEWKKVASTKDISDTLTFYNGGSNDATYTYYFYTKGGQQWTANYGSTGAMAINEHEWKGVSDPALQGGAVQMSYIYVNGKSVYDINATDNGAYNSTHGTIVRGEKYAPIVGCLYPYNETLGGSTVYVQIPNDYPGNQTSLKIAKGFFVYDTATQIKYEVTRDIQWDYVNNTWVEHTNRIETSVLDAKIVTDASSAFALISVKGNDYAGAGNTYAGETKTALSFAQSENFRSHVLIDGVALSTPTEAFLNVWNNKGYFSFSPVNSNATKITILAGCEIPTYNALRTNAKEVYVTTEDITFKKGSDGTWAVDDGWVDAGEYATSVKTVTYARDKATNWMMFSLSNKDYPSASENYNIKTTEEKVSALNLYDKIVVDGFTLRALIATNGYPAEAPKINLWVADCFAIRIAGKAGALDGAQTVTIKAGAQFPSYAYIQEGIEAYYVTEEDMTFVNVGADNGAWQRQYEATFVADGTVVEKVPYLVGGTIEEPAVPEKAGYRGSWASYSSIAGGITVNAVYTKAPTVLGTTGIKELRRIDNTSNILVINPTTSDYPATNNLDIAVSHLEKFNILDYVFINGKSLRTLGVTESKINKFTRFGLGLTTVLSDSMTIELKKGCEIPSYQFQQAPTDENALTCYVLDADYTATYSAGGEAAFAVKKMVGTPEGYEDAYILSDLYNVAYSETAGMKDGIETLKYTDGSEADYHYGFLDSKSFTLSFDFSYTNSQYYGGFTVNLGTRGHNGAKACFGWRFYPIRGNSETGVTTQNQCVQFYSSVCDKSKYESGNIAAPALEGSQFIEGQVYSITIGYKLVDGNTVYTFVTIDGALVAHEQYEIGGTFSTHSPYMNSVTFYAESVATGTIVVSDPDMDRSKTRYELTLENSAKDVTTVTASSYVLPTLNPADYDMGGKVFVGWTSDPVGLTNLYPAGYEFVLTGDTKLTPIWMGFTMQDGAAVRTAKDSSGIRFLVDVERGVYDAGVELGFILESGTIVAPTNYLVGRELTHALGEGYYATAKTEKWRDNDTYTAAFINISESQYARALSARGYIKLQYTSGIGYIYTSYDEAQNSRSIYEVATEAYKDKYAGNEAVQGYVNSVADVTVGSGFDVVKNAEAVGNYNVQFTRADTTVIVTVNSAVKDVVVNGMRVVYGQNAKVMIDGCQYELSSYALNGNGLTFTFTVSNADEEATRQYYISVLKGYISRSGYTAEHDTFADGVAQEAIDSILGTDGLSAWKSTFETAVQTLDRIKTAKELDSNDTGKNTLPKPVLAKGLGYTVTWNKVENADYYIVHDDNDYRERIVYASGENAYSYETEVVGAHNVSVTAHSFYEEYNSSTSDTIAAVTVKPVFSYKSTLDGLYKFSSSQMSTLGISTTGCYYDSSDEKYFVYYNKETGWSPNGASATDWTSPAEFPAHAQRLKDMGNNIILLAYDTNGSYKAEETWVASRMKYVMDTAWSMGMKVLVCDEVFYDFSMSDNSGIGATSKAQVTAAINARDGFAEYVTHPAFYGFSLDDEPYGKYISAMSYTISALDEACSALGVEDPFYLACLFQYQGGEVGKETYLTKSSLESYYNKWLGIDGVDSKYLYVDIYTKHAMGQPTNRYNDSFDVVYGDGYLGGKYEFHQALTAHTQNSGTLLEQDLYMSLLYAAAHDVAGYSWFCYFPITGEMAASMVGFDGNGYGNGIGNNASGSYYNAAKIAGYQFELIQGLLDGYDWKTRNVDGNLLTTTLSNGTNTATMYVNADVTNMKNSVSCTASGSQCYLVGYGVGTAEAPYQAVSGSITLQPGQALICIS